MNINHILNIPCITFHFCDRLIYTHKLQGNVLFKEFWELHLCLSTGAAVDTYETPPTSPYSLVSTLSPTTQLVSISNCTNTATPETAQDALSPPLISTNQNDSLLDIRTGPTKEAEKEHEITQAPSLASHPSGVCVNGYTEVDAELLQECLNTLQLKNTEESAHTLNGESDSRYVFWFIHKLEHAHI